ncbi:endonuclease NucS [Halospeciosus flavus]|uniref:Endonuclease NucS n=1 Tax=Halospeciosus flavus TaxID=3032283 RepID=A0ABD5Z472_9EURY|nr:endonuclease NucS [Halospeciosus flavus]
MSRAETYAEPLAPRAREVVAAGLDAEAVVTLFGRCEVDYEGRASSYLGPGDRLVVLKPDGTLLVHKREQRTPVNWQPPGCDHHAELVDGQLQVVSDRSNPDEHVEILFEEIHALVRYDAEDVEELELTGTEEDLRQRILDDPSLVEAGFEAEETEYQTDAGAADIVGTDAEGHTVVVELKRRRVGPKAVGQLKRYVDAVRRTEDEAARGILVAPSVTDTAHELLDEEGLEFVSLEP